MSSRRLRRGWPRRCLRSIRRRRCASACSRAATATAQRAVEAEAPRSPRRVLAFLSAAAALVALALGLYAVSLQQRIRVLEEELRARVGARRGRPAAARAVSASRRTGASQIRAILAAPDLRRIDLAGQKAAPGASGRAFWSPAQGLVVAFDNLPATSADRVYQLWVIPPGGAPRRSAPRCSTCSPTAARSRSGRRARPPASARSPSRSSPPAASRRRPAT